MKRIELVGVLLAAALALTACGRNDTKEAENSTESDTASVGWEKTDDDAPEAESTESEASINTGDDDDALMLEIDEMGLYVSKSGMSSDTVYTHYAGVITNPNDKAAVFPTLKLTIENPDGTIVAADTHTGMYVMPGDTIVLGSMVSVVAANVDDDAEIWYEVDASDYVSPDTLDVPSSSDLEITNVLEQQADWKTMVTGKITNNYSSSCDIALTALFRSEGEIVGMETTYMSDLAAGETTAFEIDSVGDLAEHDSVEVYAQSW